MPDYCQTRAFRWGVEMSNGSIEWYDTEADAARFSMMMRQGNDPTGRIIERLIVAKIEERELTQRSDYNGCGQWDGTPGASHCCDLPIGHSGPHHADRFWPAAAETKGESE